MPSEQHECRALLLQEREKAIEVQKLGGVFTWWIPRSEIGYLRKTRREDGKTEIVFTLPEWLVEKSGCWDLVP